MLDETGLVAEKPLMLVTMDHSRQFEIDERGVLRELTVKKAATRRQATIAKPSQHIRSTAIRLISLD